MITRSSSDNQHILRRRHCNSCDHRWYTLQDAERVINWTDFSWVGRDNHQKVIVHEHRPA